MVVTRAVCTLSCCWLRSVLVGALGAFRRSFVRFICSNVPYVVLILGRAVQRLSGGCAPRSCWL